MDKKCKEVVIGLCVTPLKLGKLKWGDIPATSQNSKLVAQYPRRVVPIAPADMDDDAKVGHIDVLLCKLTDLMAVEDTNERARSEVATVEGYIARHPEVIVVDPVAAQRQLVSRTLFCGAFERLREQCKCHSSAVCSFPRSTVGSADGLTFPVFCKPEGASGDAGHRMAVAFGPRGVKAFAESAEGAHGFVCQEYVNHGARLFKAFYVGKTLYTQERPSLPDLEPWDGTGEEPPLMSFDNTKPAGPQVERWHRVRAVPAQVRAPTADDYEKIREAVLSEFDVTLYGLDVITDAITGKFVVIDINYFPSYRGCATCGEVFDNLLVHLEAKQQQQQQQ